MASELKLTIVNFVPAGMTVPVDLIVIAVLLVTFFMLLVASQNFIKTQEKREEFFLLPGGVTIKPRRGLPGSKSPPQSIGVPCDQRSLGASTLGWYL